MGLCGFVSLGLYNRNLFFVLQGHLNLFQICKEIELVELGTVEGWEMEYLPRC